jgi:hypothetical protein
MNLRKTAQWLLIIVAVGIFFSGMVLAQDEDPTDRPFPTPVASPTVVAPPTERPFPTIAVTEASITAETTQEITLPDAIATANSAQSQVIELQSQVDTLNKELEASKSDTGATTYAIVIVVLGIIMGLAVLFGLRGGAR